jgi:hypothetical protein
MITFWTLYASLNAYSTASVKADDKSTWKIYLDLDQKKRYLYITYITSVINAFGCLIGFYLGLSNCTPPEDKQVSGFLGNTYLRNEYCVDHPNLYEVLAVQYFLGYLLWDTYVCVVMIGDVSSAGAVENLIHHGLGILGCIGNLLVGRYVTVLSTASMFTELSTPFCNIRYFLATHKKTKGQLFIVNGLMFLFSFFLARNCFQGYLVAYLYWPAFSGRDNFAINEPTALRCALWFLCVMYFLFCGLNLFWLYKIFTGALKALGWISKPVKKEKREK